MTIEIAPVLGPIGSLADQACSYAELGMEIFPANQRDKTPLTSQLSATTDLDTIEAWWSQWPEALIGHRISPLHLLLDVDPRHNGMSTWKALKAEMGTFTTRTHRSGRGDGGGHIWFQRPSEHIGVARLDAWAQEHNVGHAITDNDGNELRWSAGIDLLQHDHRYTILPPSLHPETRQPYQWTRGKGFTLEPAPMPQLLCDLLVRDESPPQAHTTPRDLDVVHSIADWFCVTFTWRRLLEHHDWVLISGDGDSDGSRWRHPEASAPHSATITHGCLFVYSPNTPFEPTAPGDVHGYTLFRAYATLEHQGQLDAAGRAARKLKDSTSSLKLVAPAHTNGSAPEVAEPTPHLPDEFWRARPALAHVRQAAHARQRSADAVLHAVLARVAAFTPYTTVLPAIVGSKAPLSYFAVVVGPTGAGKSSAVGIGTELAPAPEWIADQLPLGSGEGLAEVLFDLVEEPDDKGKLRSVKRQVRHGAFVFADEGQVLTEIADRNGSTLLPTLRTMWTGGTIGQTNASSERKRVVPAGSYVFGVVLGLQPSKAGKLLADADAGTPGRFGWASATDPTIPDEPPAWPGPLSWKVPPVITGGTAVDVAPEIIAEVRSAGLAVVRGHSVVHPLDAHGNLYRLKVAALLAVLDGRHDINGKDWLLAGMVRATSDAVRGSVQSAVAADVDFREQQTINRVVRQASAVEEARERRRLVVECAEKVKEKVEAEPERWTVATLKRDLSKRQRLFFDEALAYAVDEEWVHEVPAAGQGTNKRTLRPGQGSS